MGCVVCRSIVEAIREVLSLQRSQWSSVNGLGFETESRGNDPYSALNVLNSIPGAATISRDDVPSYYMSDCQRHMRIAVEQDNDRVATPRHAELMERFVDEGARNPQALLAHAYTLRDRQAPETVS